MAPSRSALLTLAALAALGCCVCAPQGSVQGGVQGGAQVPPGAPHSTSQPGTGGVRRDDVVPRPVGRSKYRAVQSLLGGPRGASDFSNTSPCRPAHIYLIDVLPMRFSQYSRGRGYRDWRTRGDPTLINSLWRSRQPLGIRKQLGNAEVYIVLALLIGFVTVVVGCWLSDNCWSPEPEDVLAGG